MSNTEKIKSLKDKIQKSKDKVAVEQEKISKWQQDIDTLESLEVKKMLKELELPYDELKKFLEEKKAEKQVARV